MIKKINFILNFSILVTLIYFNLDQQNSQTRVKKERNFYWRNCLKQHNLGQGFSKKDELYAMQFMCVKNGILLCVCITCVILFN